MNKFELVSNFKPAGDQPKAIEKLADGYEKYPLQVLHGITGSGKTFTIANVVAQINKPTLVLVHNKTLAFQLYSELKELFPKNRVEYFVSYFDYYQPESFIPATNTYIEKDSRVNKQIELMRLKATASLMTRNDVIIVSSISCLYGIGSPSDWKAIAFEIKVGQTIDRMEFFRKLVALQYDRNDIALESGRFRVKGNTVDLILGYEKNIVRFNFVGNKIVRIVEIDAVSGSPIGALEKIMIFPARHYIVPEDRIEGALKSIKKELKVAAPLLPELEGKRLIQRTNYDMEMIVETGYCNGIENYSSHFENRKIEDPPFCLLDFFPKDFLLVIDESHQTLSQSHAMYFGDRSRKKNLVENGFRLPSAYGNRPLKFEEFEKYFNHVVCISATPAEYELQHAGQIVQQFIRPTGLLDPILEIRPVKNQVDDLINEVQKYVKNNHRILVTTLTKQMAEDLTEYLSKAGVKVRYLHSEIDSIQRTEIIRQLRIGAFDVLVGINLLREGLDIPEVALVGVLDADKAGFLRDEKSLIQTIGRAARNAEGKVILYADNITDSIRKAYDITTKRREMQEAFNKENGITPKTIYKAIPESEIKIKTVKHLAKGDVARYIAELEGEMYKAAENLEFEKAIEIREQITVLKKQNVDK
ncbi:TPA: excinuclease ABC subunit B [Candidatus Dependentiae bacterium]|nr:MAG: UvrABC system protein B [candidate division TM6 bacterium GW2011_GWE2_31_21]KKP53271.1 MAG: UvrABC system protein B [candidate division TM6 bacterium GW2011_GWF2_33_332]HBS48029.1 excinuclease ABC subunit B [Candidatus Dependentiae bacterium]HBZ73367.1 excinuclease ABC subunit B [Candidatus Dependentiae bacterium]